MRRELRFDDFREITARFDSPPERTRCGHAIQAGDRILYHRKGGVYCAACSRRWAAEVAEEEHGLMYER